MCWSFFVISRSCTHSSERLNMRYESLRNVTMHFKAFKCVKNAFHSSAVVTLLLFELRMCGAMTLISSRITSKRLWRSSRRTKRPWRISILGSLLYLIYINDFHNCSKLLDFHLFADDATLFFKHKDLRLESEIDSELANAYIWLSANTLSLNIEKSNLIFHPVQKRIPRKVILFINNQSLTEETSIRYLEVYIYLDLWNPG